MTMEQAWERFDRAVSFEAKAEAAEKDGKDGVVRMARKAADKNLDEAVALEAEALA